MKFYAVNINFCHGVENSNITFEIHWELDPSQIKYVWPWTSPF